MKIRTIPACDVVPGMLFRQHEDLPPHVIAHVGKYTDDRGERIYCGFANGSGGFDRDANEPTMVLMPTRRRKRNKLATITAAQAWLNGYARDHRGPEEDPPMTFGRGGRRKRKARARWIRLRADDLPW